MTCGSVDDGKSTLIGHLLYDAKMLFADQERALELESSAMRRDGVVLEGGAESNDDIPDYSLLLDGLSFEREQGITIDVAYRYFATEKRSFIVSDTPGHEEYTRNMAVAASQSDLSVLLVDACKGVVTQTARHLRICSMMGIRDFVFAINKMDAAGYDKAVYESIKESITALMDGMPKSRVQAIPLSALKGDNVTERSGNMPWYEGPSLLEYLETADAAGEDEEGFVMPVQRVSRGGAGSSKDESVRGGCSRYLQGNIACGAVSAGDSVTIYPGGLTTEVSGILSAGEETDRASKGEAVSITLADDIDVSRGHVLASGTELKVLRMFEADVLWMDEKEMTEGRSYILRLGTKSVNATVMKIKHGTDPVSGARISCRRVEKNDLACIDLICHEDLVFDSFDRHRSMGRFILIDKVTNSTAGCGTVKFALRRSENLTRQEHDITPEARARALGQTPKTIWFTGLSGSGKSAVANELEKMLAAEGKHTMLLDGDNVRLGINRDLGFNDYDRTENIRRLAEISKLMNDAGLIVITAFISPFDVDREMARGIIGEDRYIEVYVSTPLEECERRDIKGLYKKARAGEIPNFTGIGSPYEAPEHPDAEIDTSGRDASESAAELMDHLRAELERE